MTTVKATSLGGNRYRVTSNLGTFDLTYFPRSSGIEAIEGTPSFHSMLNSLPLGEYRSFQESIFNEIRLLVKEQEFRTSDHLGSTKRSHQRSSERLNQSRDTGYNEGQEK